VLSSLPGRNAKDDRSDLKAAAAALDDEAWRHQILCTGSCGIPVPAESFGGGSVICGKPCDLEHGHKGRCNCHGHQASWSDEEPEDQWKIRQRAEEKRSAAVDRSETEEEGGSSEEWGDWHGDEGWRQDDTWKIGDDGGPSSSH